jgi:phosphoribosyl-ATP pyrophosphohydrolase
MAGRRRESGAGWSFCHQFAAPALTHFIYVEAILIRMSDSLERLYAAVVAAKSADPATSRTAKLLRAGRGKMAKKLAEEAVEVVIDAMTGQNEAVIKESADLLYNLTVLWVATGIQPKDVWAEMNRRERLFGIAEKLPKRAASFSRRKVVALASARGAKRR